MESNRSVGFEKEELAKAFLLEQGLIILDTNYYFHGGELDIIAKDGEYLCFIEVKYRKSNVCGFPEEAVTLAKQKKMLRGAERYLYHKRISQDIPCRFDVVSICGEEITWIRDAFCR